MTTANAMTANYAKNGTEAAFGNRRRALRLNDRVMQKSRDFFPVKTAQHLSEITSYSTRACENWLSGKCVIPSDALAALIQSEWGRQYLSAVMTDTTPRWWTTLQAFLRRISAEDQKARAEREYRKMLDEEAAVARANSGTPSFQDDPFYSEQGTAVRALAQRNRKR